MEATLVSMGAMAFVGAATGVWGLVTAWDQKRKPTPAPKTDPVVHVEIEAAELRAEMAGLPHQLELAFERAVEKLGVPDLPEPDWHREYAEDLALSNERRVVDAKAATARMEKLIEILAGMNERLEDLVQVQMNATTPTIDFSVVETKLAAIAERLNDAVEPLAELPNLLANIRWRNMLAAQASGGGGNGGSPPPAPRRLPPAPRALPPVPLPVPSIPAPYVGGSIVVPAGSPSSLLGLIQQQLQPNCPGSSAELVLSADDSVFVGSASALGGPLSDTNYAYEITPGQPPRVYRSSFPGNRTPLGDLQLFAAAAATVHVEVTT